MKHAIAKAARASLEGFGCPEGRLGGFTENEVNAESTVPIRRTRFVTCHQGVRPPHFWSVVIVIKGSAASFNPVSSAHPRQVKILYLEPVDTILCTSSMAVPPRPIRSGDTHTERLQDTCWTARVLPTKTINPFVFIAQEIHQ
jgi:hypothetical protein